MTKSQLNQGLMRRNPVIGSQLAAENTAENYSQNYSKKITDFNGLTWDLIVLKINPTQTPPAPGEWKICMQLVTKATAQDLLRTRTLDGNKDQRILALLGDSAVVMNMRPFEFRGQSAEDVNKIASDSFQKYLFEFRKTDLTAIKRRLIGKYLDRKMSFNL